MEGQSVNVNMAPATPAANLDNQRLAPTQQLNRSCESCRGLKVRCLPDPTTSNQCQRCRKAGRACIFVAPQRRRPRKRTDSRVAQLEKEMKLMRSLLKDRLQVDEGSPGSGGSETKYSRENEARAESKENTPSIPDAASSVSGCSPRHTDLASGFVSSYSDNNTVDSSSISTPSFNNIVPAVYTPDSRQGSDVVDRGIISLETANHLVSFFINELAHFFSVVVLPSNTTALQLRRTKPVLFLSVIAAAAIAVDAKLAAILNREMVKLYAERFFVEGEKSLELVQALLLMIVFYYPPDSPLKLQFYQYTHIAATMALEIGLASKRRAPKKSNQRNAKYDEQMAEQARAVLGCYHFAAT